MIVRWLGLAAGFLSLGLSLVSFVVPVLPTVPLLIMTCFLFSRSSPRWHAWLLASRRLGPPLRLWEAHGVIETKVKVLTTSIMTACLFYPVFLSDLSALPRVWMGGGALAVFAFMWSRPGRPRAEKAELLQESLS